MNLQQNVVYFMSTQDYIKIGISKNLSSRIKQVQTGCPIRLRRVEYVNVESREIALKIEKLMHKEFSDLNTFGEWFYTIKDCDLGIRRKSILKEFGIDKVEILFDKQKDYKREQSKEIFDSINKIHFSDIPIDEKISKLNKMQNTLYGQNMENILFLSYSKNTLIDICSRYIKKNINLLKIKKVTVENQAVFEFKKELTENDKLLQEIENKKKELIEQKDRLLEEIEEKESKKIILLDEKVKKLEKRNSGIFIPDEKKVKNTFKKWDFLFNRVGA